MIQFSCFIKVWPKKKASFSISTFQFSFTLVSKREIKNDDDQANYLMDLLFGTEIWSVALVFITQDLPFFITRILILCNFQLDKNYMLYFFTVKNFLLCLFEINRIFVLIKSKCETDKQKRNKIMNHQTT